MEEEIILLRARYDTAAAEQDGAALAAVLERLRTLQKELEGQQKSLQQSTDGLANATEEEKKSYDDLTKTLQAAKQQQQEVVTTLGKMATATTEATTDNVKLETSQKALAGQAQKLQTEYDQLRQSQSELRREQSQLFKETNGLENATQEQKNRYAQLSTEIADNGQKLRGLRNETSALTQVTTSSTGSLNALRGQLRLMYQQLNDMPRATKEQQEAFKRLNTEAGQLAAEIKELEFESGRFQRNVGNYPEALGAISPAAGQATTALQNLGKVGILGIVTLLAGAVKSIFEWLDGLQKMRTEVQQISDLTGSALSEATAEIQATARAFDQDFNEVLISANSLAKAYGITLSEATQLIQDGFLNGANATNEYLSILREYPGLLKEAGVNQKELNALITLQVKEGIYSDKGIDAIKEGNLRLRERTTATTDALKALGPAGEEVLAQLDKGTISTFDAMQKIGGELQNLDSQSQVTGQVLADVFGGPGEDAGVEFISLLGDIEEAIEGVEGASTKLSEAYQKQLDAERDLAQAEQKAAELAEGRGSRLKTLSIETKTFFIEANNEFSLFSELMADVVSDIDGAEGAVRRYMAASELTGSLATNMAKAQSGAYNSVLNVVEKLQEAEAKRAEELKKAAAEEEARKKKAAAEEEARKKKAAQDAQRAREQELKRQEQLEQQIQDLQVETIEDQQVREVAALNLQRERELGKLKNTEKDAEARILIEKKFDQDMLALLDRFGAEREAKEREYNDRVAALRAENQAAEVAAAQGRIQELKEIQDAEIAAIESTGQSTLQTRIDNERELHALRVELAGQTGEQLLDIEQQHYTAMNVLMAEQRTAQIQNQIAVAQGAANLGSALQSSFGASKGLALATATVSAFAAAAQVAASPSEVTPVQKALSYAAILAQGLGAVKSIKKVNYSKGGGGGGGSTSTTFRSASVFAGATSTSGSGGRNANQINTSDGGVALSGIRSQDNGQRVANAQFVSALQSLPAPQVAVTEIARVANQVQVRDSTASA